MDFDPKLYGAETARILALGGEGLRPMPLAIAGPGPAEAREALQDKRGRDLFPDGRAPEAALSGLWLYFGFFDEAHSIAQDIPAAEGSYWHGILHRQEPDPENAGYWFQRVGRHPIFPELRERAAALLEGARARFSPKPQWDPFAFIDFCEQARLRPGSADEEMARAIQLAEWQLLFRYCALPA